MWSLIYDTRDNGWKESYSVFSLLAGACCSEISEEQHVEADGHTDRLSPRSDHYAVTGPPQHHPTLWCGAHTTPQDGGIASCQRSAQVKTSREWTDTDAFFLPTGNRAGRPRLSVRHPALTSVWVPPHPPLALCYPDCSGHGLPGDQEVHPQGPGCQKCAAGFQGDGEDRGFWTDERPEPGDRSLCHVSTQADTLRVVRRPGIRRRGT